MMQCAGNRALSILLIMEMDGAPAQFKTAFPEYAEVAELFCSGSTTEATGLTPMARKKTDSWRRALRAQVKRFIFS
jgi:hypothetical protein